MQPDIIRRFHTALPKIRTWIDKHLESQLPAARKVDNLPPLTGTFPNKVLEGARMVLVGRTPFPPVSQLGLPEFAAHEHRQFDAITLKNTFFVVNGRQTVRLQFHELVHIVQWSTLGADRFLLAYGLGLLRFGYEQSPLERMAYELEEQFAHGRAPRDVVRVVEEGSEAIWNQAAPIVGAPTSTSD
jgi:hypothetical protein